MLQPLTLVLATHNPNKIREIREMLPNWHVVGEDSHADETETTFRGNALLKARALAPRHSGAWVIADDSGLEVEALKGAPGVYSARYAGHDGDTSANNALLLKNMAGVKNRRARFTCAVAIINPQGQEYVVEGHCPGEILEAPRGTCGFGYDPLFRPVGETRSFAELTPPEKNRISHRGHALQAARIILEGGTPFKMPRVLAWEVTRQCPMKCKHCRAAAQNISYAGELSTAECERVIDSLPPGMMIIWTGGEPMLRADLVPLIRRATARGIRSVAAPCGKMVTPAALEELKAAGVMALSFSLDGASAAQHDAFRGVSGAYAILENAVRCAREVGMPFQINTTVSTLNLASLDAIYAQAMAWGATRLDVFSLVSVGRGSALDNYILSDAQVDGLIDWAKRHTCKLTCCPRAGTCIGGRGFAFLSHTGHLQTCGFVDVPCGDIRDFGCNFPALVAAAANPLGVQGNCRAR